MNRWIWQHSAWPDFTWKESELFKLMGEARRMQGRLMGAASLFDSNFSLEAQAEILIEDGISTSAIEGERMDLEAIRSSVARHLGLSTAGLRSPSRAVDGLVKILLDATHDFLKPLTLARLCGWQAALFPSGYSGLSQIKTGELRGKAPMRVVSGAIGREKIHFEAPPRMGLNKQMTQFLHWFNHPPENLDGLLRAGIAHLWFVTLHPFEDGNGRIARAITDLAIAQDEKSSIRLLSLSAQIMKTRKEYYDILEKTTSNGLDITAWLSWFIKQVMGACELTEITIERVLVKARFWMRHKDIELNERQRKIINRLLDVGPKGFEGGMTIRKYVNLTKTSRATAYRELNELVKSDCLRPVGSGRNAAYELNISYQRNLL